MKKNKRSAAFAGAVLIAIAVFAAVFSTGCSSIYELFDIIRCGNRPHLSDELDCSESAPILYGCFDCDKLNDAVAAYYEPLTDAVASLNSETTVVSLEHSAEVSREKTVVQTYAVGAGGERAAICEFSVSGGELFANELQLPDYMNSSGLLCDSYFRLRARDVDVDTLALDGTLTVQQMCYLFVEYYEGLTGEQISTDIFRYDGIDELYMKSAVLGLYEDEQSYIEDGDCYTFNLAISCRYLLESIYESYCGCSSSTVTTEQFAELCNLFLCIHEPLLDEPSKEAWNNALDFFTLEGDDTVATRGDAAELLVAAYESYFGEISYSEFYYTDTSIPVQVKAGCRGLLNDFPTFTCLSPECEIWFCTMPEIAYCYSDTVAYDIGRECDFSSGTVVSNELALCALGRIDRYLDSFDKCSDESVIVDNSSDQSFYISQFGTGRYSYVNCMPTITAMAIKWFYPDSDVKVSDIRALYLPEYKEGWYSWQVMEALSEYDVPYNAYDILDYSYEGISSMIITELDKGNIVLAQMSENVIGESGHCFVIYGYKKLGSSCVFLVHDPGVYSGTDCFGKYPGEELEIDSAYACFIINRIAYNIISVGDN